jgi:hypothetical protein
MPISGRSEIDPVLEVGVVADLRDDEAVGSLLHVDAVEAVADRACRAHAMSISATALRLPRGLKDRLNLT